MVPQALFRRTFLLWTFRILGRVTVREKFKKSFIFTGNNVLNVLLSGIKQRGLLSFCLNASSSNISSSVASASGSLELGLSKESDEHVSKTRQGAVCFNNVQFLQEVEFSCQGSVSFTVIYPRV